MTQEAPPMPQPTKEHESLKEHAGTWKVVVSHTGIVCLDPPDRPEVSLPRNLCTDGYKDSLLYGIAIGVGSDFRMFPFVTPAPVYVGEPNVEDTTAILRGLTPRYEAHHKGVRIKDSALVAAAELSNRYIADRFLPDKAIDLMDEATSRLAMELESVPTEIDQLQRKLTQLEMAARQLADETEEHAKDRLDEINDAAANFRVGDLHEGL